MQRGISRKSNGFTVKRSDVLWHLHQPRVFQAIASLLGVKEATTSTPGWFGKRSKATRNVLNEMTADELAAVDADVKRIKNEGYPDEIKRRYVVSRAH